MDELILTLSPTAPKQKLSTVKNGSIIEEKLLPLDVEKFVAAIGFLSTKYNINSVKVIGNEAFVTKFVTELTRALSSSKYSTNSITITYLR